MMTVPQVLVLGFIGALLCNVAFFGLAFFVVRRWLEPLVRIASSIERRDARRDETDKETLALLRKMTDILIGLMDGMNVLGQAQRSMSGKTERLYQYLEHADKKARGIEVPELEQRQYRTVEENDLIAKRGEQAAMP